MLIGQQSSDQNDHRGQKSKNETCNQNPQSCAWLVIWQNQFGPKIQIKCVDTRNQLEDMLTKGSFTRDEWDHLLRLLNIMNSSMFSCSHFLSNRKKIVMSKRAQESTSKRRFGSGENRDQWIWCHGTSWAQRKPLRKIRVLRTARWMTNCIRVMFHPASRNWCETGTKTQQRFPRAATRWHSIF